MRTMSSSAIRASCTVSLRNSCNRALRSCTPLNNSTPATSSSVTAINRNMRVTILTLNHFSDACCLAFVVTDAAHDFIGANDIGRLVVASFGHRIRPLEVDPAATLLKAHLDDICVRFHAVRILDVQQVTADKSPVTAMRLVQALSVVTKDVEFAIDKAAIGSRKVCKCFVLSHLLNICSGALGKCLGLFRGGAHGGNWISGYKKNCKRHHDAITRPFLANHGHIPWLRPTGW